LIDKIHIIYFDFNIYIHISSFFKL